MSNFSTSILFVLLATSASLPARGEVSADEAKRLETDLTPIGGERAGNALGSIPEWTGGITSPPPEYQPGGSHPDPFARDPVLFAIDASNWEQHAAQLTEGQKALLHAHPETWRMPVYRTRRSASYPTWVYAAIATNATRARVMMEGMGGVENATVSSPFPIPNSGVEVIWNHNLRWRGVYVQRSNGLAAVTRRGNYQIVLSTQEIGIRYGSQHDSPFKQKHPNVMFAVKSKIIAPALLAGNGTLGIETINQTHDPRKVWTYS